MVRWLSFVVGVVLCCPGAGRADTLVLANGDELHGEILEWALDHVVIDHPQLGELRLSLDQLAIDTGTPPRPGLFSSRFMRGWNRSINLGMNGKWGNTISLNLTAGFNFNYRDDWRRWMFTGRYFIQRGDDSDSENNARIELRRDWLIPGSRWFGFVAGRYQFDQFESWEHRTVFGFGPGYHVIESEEHALDFLLGINYTREFGAGGDNKGEGLFGIDYTWRISARQTLTLRNNLFFELIPTAGELRNLTTGEWKVRLTNEPKLSLVIGAENEWDSSAPPGEQENDLKYYMSLGLDF